MVKVLDRVIPGVAQLLLRRFGTDATLRLHEETAFQPGTMTSVSAEPVELPIQVVLEARRTAQIAEALGLEVRQDRQVIFAAKGLPRDPRPDDAFIVDGKEVEIVDLDPVYSGDLVAIWIAGVKR